MKLDPLDTLSRLVSISSVNPMGREVSGPPFGEGRLTNALEAIFAKLGLRTVRQPVHPGRDNLLARLEGSPGPEQGGTLVLLEAHQDTVPVEGMRVAPFKPEVRGGRLWGRGACDVKGGMTAMLVALSRLAELPVGERPTVLMACTVNEEYGFTGARALADRLASGGGETAGGKPDLAVVAEPTGLDVVVAHKGVMRCTLETSGRAAHSAQPERGENAIYRMARIVAALERYHRQTLALVAGHPLCGAATLSVGVIAGGVGVNTVPDRCTIQIDRRLRPDETAAAAHRHLGNCLRGQPELDFPWTLNEPYMTADPLSDRGNGALADGLSGVARRVAGQSEIVGVPYGTDGPCYQAGGVRTVVFGPGSIDQAHTDEEWIALDQVEQAGEILYRFLADLDGLKKAANPE